MSSSVPQSTETPYGGKTRRIVLGLLSVVAVVASGVVAATPVAANTRAATSTNGYAYTGINPFRAEDTRTDGKTLGPGGTVNVTVAGGTTGIPSTAVAVVATVTVTDTTASSYITVYPAGGTQPTASNQNWPGAGSTIAARAVVKVGSNGQITAYNFAGTADVVVDVAGYYSATTSNSFGHYVALGSPVRVVDTRNTFQTIAPNSSQDFYISGALNPSTGVQAAILNVTVTNTQAPGFLTITPKGSTAATTSMLNWGAGQTIADRYNALLGTGGYITVFNGSAGSTDVVIDGSGYFADNSGGPSVGSLFNPLSGPTRLLDTRATGNSLGTNGTQSLTVTGGNGIPAGATAVEQNLTVTDTTASSYLEAYPNSRPLVSDVNWQPGWTIANSATTTLNSSGAENFYNLIGTVDLVVDASGYYSPAPGVQVTANPASVPANPGCGASCQSQINATITDSNGNPVVGDTVSFSLSGAACSGSTSGNNATLNAASTATGTTGANGQLLATITYNPSDTIGVCTVNAVEAKFGQTGNVQVTQTAVKNTFSTPFNCTTSTLPADGTSTTTCSGVIHNGVSGAAVSGDTVNFSMTGNPSGACGSVTPTTTTTDSSGNFSTTYKTSTTNGFCTLTATETGTGATSSTTVTQTQNPTPTTNEAFGASNTTPPADGKTTSTLTVQVCGGAGATAAVNTATNTGSCTVGTAVSNDYINLSMSGSTGVCGTLSATNGTTNASGTFNATYTTSTTAGTCTITAREAAGGQSKTVGIAQSAAPRSVSGSANPSTLPADGSSTSTLTATIKDVNGNVVSGDSVTFVATTANPAGSCGGISGSPATTNNSGVATATYTASTTSGFCTITITDTTGGGSTTVTINQTGAGPSSVTVAANPTSVPADGASTSTITATVKNSSGGAVAGDVVAFSTSASPSGSCGAITAVSGPTNPSGQTTATYTATTTVGTCTITATEATGGHSGTTTVTQTAIPNVITFTAPNAGGTATMPANGTSTVLYTVHVTNSGNAVAGDTVAVTTSGNPSGACGSLSSSSLTTDSSGNASTTYTASTTTGFCNLTFTESGSGKAITGTVDQTQNPTPTTSMAISPSTAQTLSGNGTSTVTFTVQVCSGTQGVAFGTCSGGTSQPVSNDLVHFYFGSPSTYCGSLSTNYTNTNASGQATVTYTSYNNSTGSTQDCMVQAQEANGGATAGPVTVHQTTRPRTVGVTANPATIASNSSQSSTITATVTNPDGTAANLVTVTFAAVGSPSTTCGNANLSSTTATTNSSGVATVTLSAGTTSGFCTITATEPLGGSGSTTVRES